MPHVDKFGVVIPDSEQALNVADKPFSGIFFVDADGNKRSMASKVLKDEGLPVRKARNVIRVKGKPPADR